MTTKALIETYINGNIKDAKIAAMTKPEAAIFQSLMDDFNYSERKARLTASHIKGSDCWQAACDAK